MGSYVQLCPTSCVSPHMFHCQINMADRKQKLQQLMDELQDHYENLGEKEQALANPTTGLNCAAVFAGWLGIINNGSFQMTLEITQLQKPKRIK